MTYSVRMSEPTDCSSATVRGRVFSLLTRATRLRGFTLYLLLVTVGGAISLTVDLVSGRYSWSMPGGVAFVAIMWFLAWPGVVRAWRRTDIVAREPR